ncbi:MAG: hypothetical protein ACREMF_05920 [Gemmatimonadales bacterium]
MSRKSSVIVAVAGAAIAAGAAYALMLRPPDLKLTTQCGTESGTGCAPENKRVDLVQPSFSNPTNITNPLFPASEVVQTLLLGNVDGHPLRVEYTLLPGTKAIEWNGQAVETRIVQYVAYLDRRIEEVALDWYAQADDGSVWYFGEDVSNYRDGVVENTEGTWLAGKDGPPAMIMPAHPQVGDVYRVENIPGVVFEEITVKSVGRTVDGPHGPVTGAMVGDQFHVDGSHSDKTFAPGYGEFSTERGGDIEAVSVAVPIDALSGPVPAELETVLVGATSIFETVRGENWAAVSATLKAMNSAWDTFRTRGAVPILLDVQMNRALAALAGDALSPAVNHRNVAGARKAAIDVGQAGLDLMLRHRPPSEIDLARLELWARQLLVDAGSEDPGAPVIGDVASLERIRDRIAHTLQSSDAETLDALLGELRTAAADHEFVEAAAAAARLRALVQRLTK